MHRHTHTQTHGASVSMKCSAWTKGTGAACRVWGRTDGDVARGDWYPNTALTPVTPLAHWINGCIDTHGESETTERVMREGQRRTVYVCVCVCVAECVLLSVYALCFAVFIWLIEVYTLVFVVFIKKLKCRMMVCVLCIHVCWWDKKWSVCLVNMWKTLSHLVPNMFSNTVRINKWVPLEKKHVKKDELKNKV